MKIRKWIPPIPKEHGAWVMWILPWCMGVAIARRLAFEAIALWFTCAGLFCLRSSTVALVKRWRRGAAERKLLVIPMFEYLALTGIFATPFYRHLDEARFLLPIVIVFFVLDVFLVARRWDKSFVYEAVGIAALNFSGPAAIYVSSLPEPTARVLHAMLSLWLLTVLYFVGTVFHVRLLKAVIVHRDAPWSTRAMITAGAPSLVYFCGSILGVAICGRIGWLPAAGWTVLIPSFVKLLYFLLHLIDVPINLRRSGKWEIAHAILFGVLAVCVTRF